MKLQLNEENYRKIIGRLKEDFKAYDGAKVTRGSLVNTFVNSHADNSNSRHFLQIPMILESIRELSLGEEKMYSIFYSMAKYEYDRSPKGTYNSIAEIKVGLSQKELMYRLRAKTHNTVKKYYDHLEKLGLIESYKGSNSETRTVRCLLDLEYISNDEIDSVINFIGNDEKAYRETTLTDYAMLDAYTGRDTKAEVEKIRSSNKDVSGSHDDNLSGDINNIDDDLEQSERLKKNKKADKSGVKGVNFEKSEEIIPLTRDIEKEENKEKEKESTIFSVMDGDFKNKKFRREAKEKAVFEKEMVNSFNDETDGLAGFDF